MGKEPVACGRRERSRVRNSVVMRGRGRVEGPEAWKVRARVLRKRGRRGGARRGEVVPLGGLYMLVLYVSCFWWH